VVEIGQAIETEEAGVHHPMTNASSVEEQVTGKNHSFFHGERNFEERL
jgi:hypothetical protein